MKLLKSKSISPFGGLNFVFDELKRLKIDQLINNELPTLAKQSKYDWKDIIFNLWSVFLCGGDCAEDLGFNLKNYLLDQPFFRVSSPDRVLNRIKELSEKASYFQPKRSNKSHHFSINDPLSSLNLCLLQKLGVFRAFRRINLGL